MVTKGIITSIDFNGNTCKVRVPFFETAGNDPIIGDAIISNTPGMYNGYKVGDVVLVAFEDGQMDNPVVIGKLYLGAEKEKADPRGSLNTESLTASKTASMPADTKLTADTDKNLPNTMNPYANLSSIANNLNKLNTDVTYLDAFTGNQFRSIITNADGLRTAIIQNDRAIELEAANRISEDEELSGRITINADKIENEVLHKNIDGDQYGLGWHLDKDAWKITALDTTGASEKPRILDIVEINRGGMAINGNLKLQGYTEDTITLYAKTESPTVAPTLFELIEESASWTDINSYKTHYIKKSTNPDKYVYITAANLNDYNITLGTLAYDLNGYNAETNPKGWWPEGQVPTWTNNSFIWEWKREYKYSYIPPNMTEISITGWTSINDYINYFIEYQSGYVKITEDNKTTYQKFIHPGITKAYTGTLSKWDYDYTESVVNISGALGASATSYWLKTSTKVHTGTNQEADIIAKPLYRIGEGPLSGQDAGVELPDEEAYFKYSLDGGTTWNSNDWTIIPQADYKLTIRKETVLASDIIIKLAHKHTSSGTDEYNEYEEETITYSPLNSPIIDLNNDADVIKYLPNGTKITADAVSTAQVYLGGSAEAARYEWSITSGTGTITQSENNQKVTVTSIASDSDKLIVTCTATTTEFKDEDNQPVTITKDFVVSREVVAASYWLSFSPVHTGKLQQNGIEIKALAKLGNNSEGLDDDAYLRYSWDNGTTWEGNSATNGWAKRPTINIAVADIQEHNLKVQATHDATGNNRQIYEDEEITYSPLNTPVLDLTNDSASLPYNGNDKIGAGTISSFGYIWLNGEKIPQKTGSGSTAVNNYEIKWEAVKEGNVDSCTILQGTGTDINKVTVSAIANNIYTARARCTITNIKDYPGTTLIKDFVIAKALKGDIGATGTSVDECVTYYALSNTESATGPDTGDENIAEDTDNKWWTTPMAFEGHDSTWKYWTVERRVYKDPASISWGTPVLASMLDADFISSLNIEAKRILVRNNGQTLFEADALTAGMPVQIGGFSVGNDISGVAATRTGGAYIKYLDVGADGSVLVSPGYMKEISNLVSGKKAWAFTTDENFGVTTGGDLYANSATIKGAITATSLTIASNATITDDAGNIASIVNGKVSANAIRVPGDMTANAILSANIDDDGTTGIALVGGFKASADAFYTSALTGPGSADTGLYLSSNGVENTVDIGGSGTDSHTWAISAGDDFGVTTYGALYSRSGKIGGFDIGTISLSSNTPGTDNSVFVSTGTSEEYTIANERKSGWCFGAGKQFGVDSSGNIYVGNVYAKGGLIKLYDGNDWSNTCHIGGNRINLSSGAASNYPSTVYATTGVECKVTAGLTYDIKTFVDGQTYGTGLTFAPNDSDSETKLWSGLTTVRLKKNSVAISDSDYHAAWFPVVALNDSNFGTEHQAKIGYATINALALPSRVVTRTYSTGLTTIYAAVACYNNTTDGDGYSNRAIACSWDGGTITVRFNVHDDGCKKVSLIYIGY